MPSVSPSALTEPPAQSVRALRVAAIIAARTVSGPGRQLAGLADELSNSGAHMRVVVIQRRSQPVSELYEFLSDQGVDCVLVEEKRRFDPGLIRNTREELERFQPTVVETHGYKPHAVMYALRRTGAPWPWVGVMHGTTNENRRVKAYHGLGIRLLADSDRVVVMSGLQADLFGGVSDRVHVIHNAVIPLLGTAEPLPDLTGLPRPLLGVVGRLSPEKGVDVFLRAAAKLVARGAPFGAVIAGEGPEREALEALAADLDLEGHVRFLGSVAAVRELYERIDMLVIPSRSEGLPNVLLEALDAGLPVVSTRVGAVPDVLGDRLAGVLVDPENPEALADTLAGFDWSVDRSADRQELVHRFSNQERVRRYIEVYRQAVEARDRTS